MAFGAEIAKHDQLPVESSVAKVENNVTIENIVYKTLDNWGVTDVYKISKQLIFKARESSQDLSGLIALK